MAKLPLYHQTAWSGHGRIPAWWFGAPFLGFAYAFVAPRFLPDVVSVPELLPAGLAMVMRWLVGLLLGVALLSLWQLGRWAARTGGVSRHS